MTLGWRTEAPNASRNLKSLAPRAASRRPDMAPHQSWTTASVPDMAWIRSLAARVGTCWPRYLTVYAASATSLRRQSTLLRYNNTRRTTPSPLYATLLKPGPLQWSPLGHLRRGFSSRSTSSTSTDGASLTGVPTQEENVTTPDGAVPSSLNNVEEAPSDAKSTMAAQLEDCERRYQETHEKLLRALAETANTRQRYQREVRFSRRHHEAPVHSWSKRINLQ